MSRAKVLARLEDAQSSSLGRARLLLDAIRPFAAAPWVDVPTRDAIERLALRCGESVAVASPHEPRVGETWLLLVDAGGWGAPAPSRIELDEAEESRP